MSEPLTTILINTGLILLVAAVWAGTVGYVAWDTARRRLSGCRQWLWIFLALVPFIGFFAYLIARPFVIPKVDEPAAAPDQPQKRVTYLKPPAGNVPVRLPTVPAADVLRAGQPNQPPARPAAAPDWAAGETENHTYVLLATEGPHAGEYFVIDDLPAYIGRGPGCAIPLDNDHGVSRRQAELYRQAGMLRIRDLESTHGTNVNGYDISDKGLTLDDKIRVGHSLLIVKTER
jgi:hypothetical protein